MELSLLLSLLAIFVLLILSAFFSGSETALTAASRIRLKAREKEGDKSAALTNKIRDHKDRMIGALLFGNNLVNIMASALATSVLIKLFGESGVIVATLVMTMLVLIFAEVLPKTYAFHHAESMAMRISPIIRLVIIVFAPVTEAVTWIVRQVLRLFGVDISRVAAGSHLELLRGAIEMHEACDGESVQGQTNEQRAMLRSILDLAEVDIGDIMIHRKNVTMIDAEQPVERIIEEAMNSPYTRLPLWKGNPDNIVGVLHARELLRELMDVGGDVDKVNLVRVAMAPWFTPETTTLFDQLQAFRERKEHFAVVIDEYGSFMGIVTLEDILEEIVGEIDDEHDETVSGVRRLSNGSYIVDGTVPIRDLNRAFDWGLPHDEYATIAGLVLFESQMVPDAGQSFRFHGFQIDVVRKQRNQITLVRIIPPP
ncbi:MAG: HlyC/CorC family transporter [Alphaproteobacteria bacterium]